MTGWAVGKFVCAVCVCIVLAIQVSAQGDAIELALAALQRGDLISAEQALKSRLSVEPKDDEALSVLGVVLDQEKKYGEADQIYRRALSNSSPDPALLNNFGNHLLALQKKEEAQKAFLRVIQLDPQNTNALVQLAQMALHNKATVEAKTYLDRLSSSATLNAAQSFALGLALESAGQHGAAETYFSKTVDADPSNFEALYDFGLAASHAGHNERARTVLQQAVTRQSENVDALYDLAAVNVALDDKQTALQLLAKASKLAPQRTDVLQLEARTSAALGYFGDAARAWDEYLAIIPADEAARRERAFCQTAIGQNTVKGLAELQAFAQKHPSDAIGHYELAIAETPQQPEQAVKDLDRALVLKPDLTAAHGARGLLLYRQGKTATALRDFEFVAQKEPGNGTALDHVGETYLALDRANEAVPILRKAAEVLPSDSTILLHLGRALSKTGHQEEAAAVFARCRELGPNRSASPHPAGLVEYLGLPAAEQRERYRSGVEHTVQKDPGNAEAQVRYLEILLEEGKFSDAAGVVQTLVALKPSASLLAEASRPLLAAKQYSLVEALVVKATPAPEITVDLALAELHLAGAQAGLVILDRVPETERNGNYDLARVQMLTALGRQSEAQQAIQNALRQNATRPELCRDVALMLVKNGSIPAAVQLLTQGSPKFPNDPELRLLKALTLELTKVPEKADAEFENLESRWPDWPELWLAESLVYEARQQKERAQSARRAAVDLGLRSDIAQLGQQPGFNADGLAAVLPLLFP